MKIGGGAKADQRRSISREQERSVGRRLVHRQPGHAAVERVVPLAVIVAGSNDGDALAHAIHVADERAGQGIDADAGGSGVIDGNAGQQRFAGRQQLV